MKGLLNIGSQLLNDRTNSLNSNTRYLILYKKNGERYKVIGRNGEKKFFLTNIFKVENYQDCCCCLNLIPVHPITNKLSYSTPVAVSISSILGYQWICPSEMDHTFKLVHDITKEEHRLEKQDNKTTEDTILFDDPINQAQTEMKKKITYEIPTQTEDIYEAPIRICDRKATKENTKIQPDFQIENITVPRLNLLRTLQNLSEFRQEESLRAQYEVSKSTTIIPFDKIKSITLKCERKE
ncbi:CotY/CotZ family spore coat protein [Mammaliicoccus sciuri]